jgi:hypothetical protein
LGEVGSMAEARPSAVTRRLDEASDVLKAVSRLIENISNVLRLLVHLVGWLILLVSAIGLLVHPRLSPEHVIVPIAGALAILQSLIKPPERHEGTDDAASPGDAPLPQTHTLAPDVSATKGPRHARSRTPCV